MNTTTQAKTPEFYAARVMMIGMILGLACMAALFIAGLVKDSAGMMVVAGSCAALLAAVWSSTSVAAKKKAAAKN